MNYLIEFVGWIGSGMVLLAYALNSYKKLNSDSLWFGWLNLIGAGMLIFYTVVKQAYASTFINVVWVIIAVVGIIRYFRQQKN